MAKVTVLRREFPPGQRLLVVSDIHGNLPFFKALLSKANFHQDDRLILVGDLVEKGAESLATLRYVMALSQTHTVYTLCGNCDDLAANFLDESSFVDKDFFGRYLSAWKEKCLLVQMGLEVGVTVETPADLPRLREAIRTHFQPEIAFLRSLPIILESDRFIFVHGGVPREDRLEALEGWSCMKNDAFLMQGHTFHKWVVVGHWPVTLYDPSIPAARPIIDRTRHIISIDGGCSLELDGQLNALIIPDSRSDQFSYLSYDGLPVAPALDAQAPSEDPINIRWSENKMELLERGTEFSRCRHLASGRVLHVINDYLYEKKGITRCEDSTDYQLPVVPGDLLSIVRRTKLGVLAKKDGVTGWYLGRLGPEKLPEP